MLSDDEKLVRSSIRRFVAERYLPRAAELFRDARFPVDLVPELAELGVFGARIDGYGCAGMSSVEYGLLMQELERGDSGLRSFVSVQGSLAMEAIHAYGSEEQKQRWLPEMAAGRALGCFGLTEPNFGSNPAGMTTRARRDSDGFVLNGEKTWITNGSIAHHRRRLGESRRHRRGVRFPGGEGNSGVFRLQRPAQQDVDAGVDDVEPVFRRLPHSGVARRCLEPSG